MTSHRKRKKQATALGLTARELELVEILEEVLESMRWVQILGYSNQYLLEQELDLTKEQRDRVLEAATRSVERDAKLHEWRSRLASLKGQIVRVQDGIERDLPPTAAAESTASADDDG